ncbi:MAG: Secretion system effector C (SseC) like family [Rhodobacteraceae bacterium HLUCCO07]|nr:MAG: Secretion system effector C (SseC) like family [Rhodobacteraceae bacterium HLUCCO07]
MIVEAVEPETGKTIQMECAADSEDEIRDLLSFDLSEDSLKKRIDALAVSADAKSVLFTIAKTTIRVGSIVVKIGRKVLDIITKIIAEFPMASTGTIFGAIFGYLVSSVPIIGLVFGPFIGALAIAFGFAVGAMQDIGNKALERRIMSAAVSFEALKPKV